MRGRPRPSMSGVHDQTKHKTPPPCRYAPRRTGTTRRSSRREVDRALARLIASFVKRHRTADDGCAVCGTCRVSRIARKRKMTTRRCGMRAAHGAAEQRKGTTCRRFVRGPRVGEPVSFSNVYVRRSFSAPRGASTAARTTFDTFFFSRRVHRRSSSVPENGGAG